MGIAQRSIRSTAWQFFGNLATIPIGFIQSIVLARLLPVDYFGIYTGMVAIVSLSSVFFQFGLGNAYLHRAPETEDSDKALSVLFTLKIILDTFWAVLLLGFALIFLSDLRQMVLIVLTIGTYLQVFTNTPKLILMRQVKHQRVAFITMTSSILVAIFSIAIAITSQSIWALLAGAIVPIIWNLILLYVWRPVWFPKLSWDPTIIRYYFSFGGKVQGANILWTALERLDDLWTNVFLGDLALGYYSRAYKFATYPRMFIANPVSAVATTTYAELAEDRKKLSQAFFRVNALLIRSGFLFAGWLALIAPQLIIILLGEQWLPMLEAFRLMLIFTMLDPLKGTFASLLIVVGKPEKVVTARSLQLIVMILGLFILGTGYQIAGVALAVDIMLFVGMGFLYFYVKGFVDFSLKKLIGIPLIALFVGLVLSLVAMEALPGQFSQWQVAVVKSAVFMIIYLGIVGVFEGRTLYYSIRELFDLSAWFIRDREDVLEQ